jgi:hypothetical protein
LFALAIVAPVLASAGTVAPAPSPGTTPPAASAPAPSAGKFTYGGVVHKGSEGKTVAFPDVCKTPTPGGPVPVPYPNAVAGTSSDFAPGKYPLKGGGAITLKDSNFSMSAGDEAGTAGGGVVSNKVKGKAEFMMYSFDVKFEGKNVMPMQDPLLHNDRNTSPAPPSTASTKTQPQPPADQSQLYELADGTYCAVCMEKNRITKILKLRRMYQLQPAVAAPQKTPGTN